jgi:hypothetical protein
VPGEGDAELDHDHALGLEQLALCSIASSNPSAAAPDWHGPARRAES